MSTLYYATAVEVAIGDVTPWGAVVACYVSRGYLHLTTTSEDGEATDHLPLTTRVPLIR